MAAMFGQITAFEESNEQWATYIERFEHFVTANDIKDDKRVAVLLSVIGCDTYGLLRSLIAPRRPGEMEYADIVATLQDHFAPKPLVIGERFRFHKRNQKDGETVAQYVAVLKKLAEHCEFGDYLDEAMRDRFVCGLRTEAIQARLLTEKSLTFRKAVEVAVSVDSITRASEQLSCFLKVEELGPPANLRVILEDHDIRKLTLPSGIPATKEELHAVVRQAFSIPVDFILHYMDSDFGNQFFTLSSTDLIRDKDTVKVVLIATPVMLMTSLRSSEVEAIETPPALLPDSACPSTPQSPYSQCRPSTPHSPSTPRSSLFAETVSLPPDQTLERSVPWPSDFPIPRFSFNTELVLERANESYLKDGSLLSAPSVKTDILGKLAETIYRYVAYPSNAQICAVAQALVLKHPCLKERGSVTGYYGWQTSLKFKMGNYRTKLRNLGYPELMVNCLKQKHPDHMLPAKNVKKPKKAEVNYLPPYPPGETEESLEKERALLIEATKKKDNSKVINEKMAKTFSLRRQEVVIQCPLIADFKERWPALFTASQVNDEFLRITTIHLEAKFMSLLDRYTPRLMSIFSSKGGASGNMMRAILDRLYQHDHAIEDRREAVLRCLVKYLGEDGLITSHQDMDGDYAHNPSESQINIYVMNKKGSLKSDIRQDIAIMIGGEKVLTGLHNVPQACAILIGFTYSLNLEYPKKLRYTFEVFQKLFLELDSGKMSPKVLSLINKLLA